MADDPAPAPKKKGGKMKFVLIGVVGLALAGGAAAAGFYMAGGAGAAEHSAEPEPPKEVIYFEVEKGFTSNLKEPDRYIEIGLGLATHEDQTVVDEYKKHEVAIRSAVLGVLAEQSVEQVATLPGKTKLQAQLKTAVNASLKVKTGKASVEDVYFTNFIIQ